MAYYECTHNNDHINIGDNFIVTLSGSHNQITTATVCYISKTTICLLGDIRLSNVNWFTACTYAWNYSIEIINKEYTGTCRIPTIQQIYSKCAGYKRDFDYWTSARYDNSRSWLVFSNGFVHVDSTSGTLGVIPFIEIIL